MTALDSLDRCPQCRSADIVHVHWGVGGRYRCVQCGNRFHEPWVASSVDAYPRPGELTAVRKMFVLLSEIRRCINDDKLMAAQQKVLAIETIVKGVPTRELAHPVSADAADPDK